MTVISRQTYHFEDLEVGMEASFAKTVSEADIVAFAEVTGDKNPVHLDAAYAAKTIFKEPIAHGMLTAGYISAVFGMELPGPGAIYVSQTLNFRGPVKVGDRVVAKVRVVELYPAKRRARFESTCSVGGKPVLEGEAVLMVPARLPRPSPGSTSIGNDRQVSPTAARDRAQTAPTATAPRAKPPSDCTHAAPNLNNEE
jgi:3-hydroxybutyryl-CoA dehydratase